MNANTTPAAPVLTEWTDRDDYGRNRRNYAVNGRTVAVRVTVPRSGGYIVNDWAATAAGGDPKDAAMFIQGGKPATAAAKAIQAREADKARKG